MQAVMQHVVLNRATIGVADTTEVSGTEEEVMFDIAILGEPTELPLQPVEEVTPIAAAEPKKVKPICEPEERLRKLLAQTARTELFALILFLTIAVVGVVGCFAELFQLLDNDAIGWIARKAAGGV
jgi:hypothetical protein